MSLWLVRAGSSGQNEDVALKNNIVSIGWNQLPDLSKIKSKDDIKELLAESHQGKSKNVVANYAGQIWAFIKKIEKGDLVVLPLKTTSAIAIGRIKGDYEYLKEPSLGVHHVRSVEWIKTDIPRMTFDQDLLYSFGAFMTVCHIKRNNAEARVKAIVEGKKIASPIKPPSEAEDESIEETPDIEEISRDQILNFINQKFKGHELSRLVDAVLQAEGYVTRISDPGPDGGVDILAGAGSMGFDAPHLCVQVKSSQSPADVNILRNLQGAMNTFKASQGLLVCWGGFNRAVIEEAKHNFFSVRLWDSGKLLAALFKAYDKLPATLQTELPLKRIWSLVIED